MLPSSPRWGGAFVLHPVMKASGFAVFLFMYIEPQGVTTSAIESTFGILNPN